MAKVIGTKFYDILAKSIKMLLIFKKQWFGCSSRNQKLQKKVVKHCQSHRNKFSGHFEKKSQNAIDLLQSGENFKLPCQAPLAEKWPVARAPKLKFFIRKKRCAPRATAPPCGGPSRAGRKFFLGCVECDFVVLKAPSVAFSEASKLQRMHPEKWHFDPSKQVMNTSWMASHDLLLNSFCSMVFTSFS